MATTQRRDVYLWVTWITGLLSGDNHCQFAPWFKGHFKYEKTPDRSFDRAAWSSEHDDLVRRRVAELTADGWLVFVEDQNKFDLRGQVATLAGKADIVATRGQEARVEDCKTGKPRHSDFWQVLTYMLALPVGHPAISKFHRLTGYVVYRDHIITVQPEEFTPELRAKLIEQVRQSGAAEPPPRVPSARECGFCDIGKADCPQRVENRAREVVYDLF